VSALTPAEVLERRREALRNQDTDGFVGLFAPDGVIELPFAAPDMPSRLEGQQAIRDFSHRLAASPLRIDDLEPLAVYQTDDPEVIIVELVTYGRLTGTGRTLAGTSIQVFRIRDGKIVLFRDYFNPRGFEEHLRD
jgi:ketosteroid isomerase-like protein